MVVALVLECLKALADGLLGQGGYPQALHRTFSTSLLHHPALDEFTLLPGIAAVDDAVGGLHEFLDDGELLLDALVVLQLDAETGRNHRQLRQAPGLPQRRILAGFLQLAEVAEGPGDLIAVAFEEAATVLLGSQHIGYITCYRWFLGDTDDHE